MTELFKISEEQKVTIKVATSEFIVEINEGPTIKKIIIIGVSVLPQFIVLNPNEIRFSIINKKQADEGKNKINEYIDKGIYFSNIKDYTTEEIQFLSGKITDKLLSEIWSLLILPDQEYLLIPLSNKKVKKIIIEKNPHLFQDEKDFDKFCLKYNLTVNNFKETAKFSYLDIKLKEIEIRFEIEQFYARRFLFISDLIEKLNNRISEYISNKNQIDNERLKLVNQWIERQRRKLNTLKEFKDYYTLYDMPKTEKKIEIKNSNNVSVISGDAINPKITQEKKTESKSESIFSKRIGLWTVILMVIGIIVTIITNWDKIF